MLKWINLNRETTAHYSKNIKDWQKKLNADNEWTILSGDGVINRKNINTQQNMANVYLEHGYELQSYQYDNTYFSL